MTKIMPKYFNARLCTPTPQKKKKVCNRNLPSHRTNCWLLRLAWQMCCPSPFKFYTTLRVLVWNSENSTCTVRNFGALVLLLALNSRGASVTKITQSSCTSLSGPYRLHFVLQETKVEKLYNVLGGPDSRSELVLLLPVLQSFLFHTAGPP